VDAATIKRFLIILYTGDFAVPDPEPLEAGHIPDIQTAIKDNISQPDYRIEADTVPAADTVAEVEVGAMEVGEEWPQERDSLHPRR
jgi:hypothetical protein